MQKLKRDSVTVPKNRLSNPVSFLATFIIPLEIILKICYNLRYNVGAGIPVGVYVFRAHKYQEMLNCRSTFLPALFFVSPERLGI